MSKYYVVINRHIIGKNRREGTDEAPIRVSKGKYGKPVYYRDFDIPNDAKLIYDVNNPMPCGATVWLEFVS
jgi:hypothetical protein